MKNIEGKSIKELVYGTDDNWDKRYSPYNGKRFYITETPDKAWCVIDINSGMWGQFLFTSVIIGDLMRVCDSMNFMFPIK